MNNVDWEVKDLREIRDKFETLISDFNGKEKTMITLVENLRI